MQRKAMPLPPLATVTLDAPALSLVASFQEGAHDNKNEPTYVSKQGDDSRGE